MLVSKLRLLFPALGVAFVVPIILSYYFGTSSGFPLMYFPLALLVIVERRVSLKLSAPYAFICIISFVYVMLYLPSKPEFSFKTITIFFSTVIVGYPVISSIIRLKDTYEKHRSELDELAHIDPLTGLHNRRYFIRFLRQQIALSKQEKTTFCIALGDVDHFKQINDNFGHNAGDAVLKKLAECFHCFLARSDLVCRWGGEEFIIYISGAHLTQVSQVMEAVREVVSTSEIAAQPVTMSFGLVEFKEDDSIESLLKRADTLLYKAKQNGRNRIEL